MVEKDSESFYSKYLRISLPFLVLIFLSFSVFALTTQDANYSGGVYNGGFEYGTGNAIANTIYGGWVGNQTYGWQCGRSGNVGTINLKNCDFNSTIVYSGLQSMHLTGYNTTTGSRGVSIFNADDTATSSTLKISRAPQNNILIKPNTKYVYSAWVYVVDANADIYLTISARQVKLDGTQTGASEQVTTKTPNEWVYLSTSFTSQSDAKQISLNAKCISTLVDYNYECFVDDISLEEVGSVSLSGQLQGRPSIVVTGVSDNAIDQSQTTTAETSRAFGTSGYAGWSQTFIPTQNKFTGISFRKLTKGTGLSNDTIITLRPYDSTTTISSTILASKTISSATMNAYADNSDIFVELPTILDANGTNVYELIMTTDSNNLTNFIRIGYNPEGGYTNGTAKSSADKTNWSTTAYDLYFKTLFEKQSSAFDLNVCSSGDSVCESKTYDIDFLENGENYLINPADAPLFYEGDNNVYFMMHSDSDYNNTTPSMMAKLTYTFDKPTTTILVEGLGSEKTITLTCTPSVLGACDKTYYNLSGTGYQEYTTPLTLTQPNNYTFSYYSTDTGENTEIPTTITITVNPLGERIQNILPSMLQLGFLLLLASIIIGLLSNILIKNEYVSLLSVIVGACAIIMIFISILL
jgi:hypothetical protein